jgi:hypothetical protein
MHVNYFTVFLLLFLCLINPFFAFSNNGGDSLVFDIVRLIQNGLDDVEERADNSMYTNSTDIELVEDGAAQTVGLRFNDLGIPQGAEILEAWIQFTTDSETSFGNCNLQIFAEASDNASVFQGFDFNVSSRPRTNAQATWVPGSWNITGSSGALQKSADLTALLQEVINRPGWESGNSMAFIIEGTGRRAAAAYELDPNQAAVLHIKASVEIPDILLENVFINEIMPANGVVLDEFGEADDWIEIYNGGDNAIFLGGLYMTDDATDMQKWQITAPLSIPPGSFGRIWADDQPEQGGNHANFKLKSGGEFLAISQELNGDLNVLDAVQFPETPFQTSYGREEDGENEWVFFGEISPVESNNGKLQYLNSPVVFSKIGGVYQSQIPLAMSTSDPEAEIYYTTDGSIPTTSDTKYLAPISITSTRLVQAKAFKTNYVGSEMTTEIYFINTDSTIPILSVQTDPENLWDNQNGIYVEGTNGIVEYCSSEPKNYNQDWERPGNITFFEANGTKGFQVNVGMKIGGGCSRGFKMKGMNFFCRVSKYGDESIEYPVFPGLGISEFRRLKIRNSGNDFEQMLFRDGINQTILWNTVDLDLMAYRPVRVYLNGEYWGVYGLREFFNEDYVASHHGVDPNNIDFITNPLVPWHDVRDGDYEAMQTIIDYVTANNMSVNAYYQTIQNWVDINEYLNYHITQIYYGNYDWPANNVRVWRDRDNGKFRWMLYDTDATTNYGWWSASNAFDNTLAHALNESTSGWPNGWESTLLLRKLMDNQGFEDEFIQRTCTFRELIFDPDRINTMADSLQAILAPEMQMHINKWNPAYPNFGGGIPSGGSVGNWVNLISQYKAFFSNRRNLIFGHYQDVLNLGNLFQLTINYTEKTPGKVVFHLNEMEVPFNYSGVYFENIPIKIKAIAKPGYRFLYWKETGVTNAEVEFVGIENSVLTPIFAPNFPIISEIHYHPKDDADYEFIEWYNPTENTVDLSGYKFTKGVIFEFPQGTSLEPSEYILTVKDQTKFSALSCQVLEWESGDLDNNGEMIEVVDNLGNIIQDISYKTSNEWPTSTNGQGPSLSLKNYYSDNSFGENWQASSIDEGTPCSKTLTNDQESITDDIVLNIFPNPVDNYLNIQYSNHQKDAIVLEVFNSLGQPVYGITLHSNTSFEEAKIDVRDWAKGIYFVSLKSSQNANSISKVFVE